MEISTVLSDPCTENNTELRETPGYEHFDFVEKRVASVAGESGNVRVPHGISHRGDRLGWRWFKSTRPTNPFATSNLWN